MAKARRSAKKVGPKKEDHARAAAAAEHSQGFLPAEGMAPEKPIRDKKLEAMMKKHCHADRNEGEWKKDKEAAHKAIHEYMKEQEMEGTYNYEYLETKYEYEVTANSRLSRRAL